MEPRQHCRPEGGGYPWRRGGRVPPGVPVGTLKGYRSTRCGYWEEYPPPGDAAGCRGVGAQLLRHSLTRPRVAAAARLPLAAAPPLRLRAGAPPLRPALRALWPRLRGPAAGGPPPPGPPLPAGTRRCVRPATPLQPGGGGEGPARPLLRPPYGALAGAWRAWSSCQAPVRAWSGGPTSHDAAALAQPPRSHAAPQPPAAHRQRCLRTRQRCGAPGQNAQRFLAAARRGVGLLEGSWLHSTGRLLHEDGHALRQDGARTRRSKGYCAACQTALMRATGGRPLPSSASCCWSPPRYLKGTLPCATVCWGCEPLDWAIDPCAEHKDRGWWQVPGLQQVKEPACIVVQAVLALGNTGIPVLCNVFCTERGDMELLRSALECLAIAMEPGTDRSQACCSVGVQELALLQLA